MGGAFIKGGACNRQNMVMMFRRHWIKETVVRWKYSLPAIPFRIALMGSGGTGKSHIIHLFKRDMLHFSQIVKVTESGQPVVLLTAPTGVASFNINGLTLHSVLRSAVGRTHVCGRDL